MSRTFQFGLSLSLSLSLSLLCTGFLLTAMSSAQAEEHGSKPAKEPEVTAKKEAHDAMPEGTTGVYDGQIIANEKSILTIMTKEETFLFAPHWHGEKFVVSDYVHITWT